MALTHLIHPNVNAQPTIDTAVWFLQLRWVAVAGQLLTMAVVIWVLKIDLPVWELLSLIGITTTTNTFYWFWLRHLQQSGLERTDRLPSEPIISGLMLADILILTGMLYMSAGIANPFALFYFVNIAVAGAIITPIWAWAVWLTTVAGITLLLVRALPIDALSTTSLRATSDNGQSIWTIPKLGFLVSFATCSGVITYFITMLTGELRQREKAIQEAEDARRRNRQLEGLATLAAGAAHELASPLSTIAVVAKELSRALDKHNAPATAKQDVVLIRSELDQCRQILDRMTSAAGEAAGERLRSITVGELLVESMLGLRHPEHIHVEISETIQSTTNLLPVQAVAQAIRNLLQNALDASQIDASQIDAGQASTSSQDAPPTTGSVQLQASLTDDYWQIKVRDQGHGMTPEVLERIGEPFFTTKEPGRGMGLGLYLTENVIRRLGGSLEFDSRAGQGTVAELRLPVTRD